MRRALGLVFALVGGGAILSAGYYIMTGHSSAPINLTDDFAVTATTAGLAGAAMFTVGLLWLRE